MLTISDGVLLMPETTTVFGLPCKADRGHDLAFGFLWQGSLRNKSCMRQRSSRSFYRLYMGLLKKSTNSFGDPLFVPFSGQPYLTINHCRKSRSACARLWVSSILWASQRRTSRGLIGRSQNCGFVVCLSMGFRAPPNHCLCRSFASPGVVAKDLLFMIVLTFPKTSTPRVHWGMCPVCSGYIVVIYLIKLL